MSFDTRQKLLDPDSHRLLYLDKEADQQFWDEKWEVSAQETFGNPPRHRATLRITQQHLPAGARVLEGGCGLGDIVHALDKGGFDAIGVDYAPNVVAAINEHWPHLSVTEGDVRNLDASDSYYDGYWSIGVIEHFSGGGYDEIAGEMHRVLRKGGYLFLSFPSFNKFRQSRARAGKYEASTSPAASTSDFFQFALNPQRVISDFELLGFELISHRGIDSLQGLGEDLPLFASLQRFLDRFSPRITTAFTMLMDVALGRYAGHSCLLILRKK